MTEAKNGPPLKTVFGEVIEVGDELMYIYKSSGNMTICFGEVMDIEYKVVHTMSWKMPHLHVHKTYQIDYDKKNCDQMVILTNPTAFKCGVLLKHP